MNRDTIVCNDQFTYDGQGIYVCREKICVRQRVNVIVTEQATSFAIIFEMGGCIKFLYYAAGL